ncbi:hypothetical protein Ctob_002804 [Chrysochromulina tobinii]|jgi:hypothetical protein|uniref:Uncharacterized protein n=1 Tax=Chrysochromulina tobinii TaxID=1460289 RepID=A0A0M0JGD4_9EUKA|nr:hypothetical protein Ctob_002804 [Chrysochromulina tobinii]|eukprot:KOO25495.1 hypothetical protein Ctob_002804 [Chrysochromulina sp. CCMP291]
MLLAAPVVVGVAGAAYAYIRPGAKKSETEAGDPGAEALEERTEDAKGTEADANAAMADGKAEDAPTANAKSWRESAGRENGPDGYVFGDLTRGVVVRLRGGPKTTEEQAAEAEADQQYSHVQVLVRDAVRIFRARGYTGTINMSQNVAYFTESCSVRVDGPKLADALACVSDVLSAEEASNTMGEHGRAGKVFATLLARLERRACAWQALAGGEDLDPMLTSSAHIGFALPVIKLGWGVSVSLTVTTSSLLRYAAHAAASAEKATSSE